MSMYLMKHIFTRLSDPFDVIDRVDVGKSVVRPIMPHKSLI